MQKTVQDILTTRRGATLGFISCINRIVPLFNQFLSRHHNWLVALESVRQSWKPALSNAEGSLRVILRLDI